MVGYSAKHLRVLRDSAFRFQQASEPGELDLAKTGLKRAFSDFRE
jgi:hypothetical protein